MVEISNRTLALLVGVALVVSVIGLFSGPNPLTGKATAAGSTNLTVLGTISIELTDSEIDFGTGTIENGDNCTIDSDSGGNSAGCTAASGWLAARDVFTLNNTGSSNMSVDIQSNSTAAEFLTGGSDPAQNFRVASTGNGNCSANNVTTLTALTTSYVDVCDDLAPAQLLDVALNVTIPGDTDTGDKRATITFRGLSVVN